jgi:hypothetical protein
MFSILLSDWRNKNESGFYNFRIFTRGGIKMNAVIIPEQRSSSDYFNNSNSYTRTLSNGAIEYCSKEFYNPNFTRKSEYGEKWNSKKSDDLENIKKEILLYLIENSLE